MSEQVTFGSRTGRAIIAAAVLGSGMTLLDGTVVNVALRTIGEDLDASLAELQWITNGYLLTMSALILLGGSLGDRYGRRRIFVVGTIWFAVASLLCGIAPSATVLIVARILQGIGAAMLTPGSLAMIQGAFEAREPGPRHRFVVGPRQHRRGGGAVRRRRHGAVRLLALDLLHQPADGRSDRRRSRSGPSPRLATPTRPTGSTSSERPGAVALGGITYALIEWGDPLAVWAAVVGVVAAVGFLLVERRGEIRWCRWACSPTARSAPPTR